MAIHVGRDFLAQIWDTTLLAGAGDWVNICGLDGREWAQSTETVDTTTADCDDPTLPLNKTVLPVMVEYSFSGDAIFKNAANFAILNDAIGNLQTIKMKLTMPEIGSWVCEAGWVITELKETGGIKDAITASMAFEPSGKVDFTAA
ncbi:MAG: hypothetical protein COC24_019240 [Alphaproteobacteria bacterium]|nr:hypothetical protein [Alphaproteobacteria bacterium]